MNAKEKSAEGAFGTSALVGDLDARRLAEHLEKIGMRHPSCIVKAMAQKTFSKKDAIRFGWNTVLNHFFYFLGLMAIVFAIQVGFEIAVKELKDTNAALSFIVLVVSWFVSIILNIGLIHISLRFCDNARPPYRELLEPARHFLSFVAASILYVIVVLIGLVLLIVPGVIWAIKFGFFRYVIVEQGAGPLEALRQSGEITKGAKWNLFLFALVLGLINALGILAFGVGLLVTIPLSMLAMAYVYRVLSH